MGSFIHPPGLHSSEMWGVREKDSSGPETSALCSCSDESTWLCCWWTPGDRRADVRGEVVFSWPEEERTLVSGSVKPCCLVVTAYPSQVCQRIKFNCIRINQILDFPSCCKYWRPWGAQGLQTGLPGCDSTTSPPDATSWPLFSSQQRARVTCCHGVLQRPSWALWMTSCLEPGLRVWCSETSPASCPRPSAWWSAAWSPTPHTCELFLQTCQPKRVHMVSEVSEESKDRTQSQSLKQVPCFSLQDG